MDNVKYESYKKELQGSGTYHCDVQTPPEPEADMCLNEPEMIIMESNKDA